MTGALRSLSGIWEDEYRVIHRDGTVRWIHGVGRRVTPAGETPEIWQGVSLDVTARHELAETVRTSEGRSAEDVSTSG